jgi:hypothetical protein
MVRKMLSGGRRWFQAIQAKSRASVTAPSTRPTPT